ncbi:hypothetical protein [Deinococcus cellulosilyticus]|uniref:Uncharacterized protein n=1 Tax=Deinococcus cellulosilyticus (strain DSM 18568 / NBRC 106333 / KACC 11606 / 5516J-15) TaxID=1223518 RepID=A0A511NBB1_DEIC1|nr:hypothetical protein [Deinococcus cellulosilyticus]GEM49846.1 hypothetical protein DC3_54810 [Deinococcus cellulosilyticus NBRC 106333 = KACC 11606]
MSELFKTLDLIDKITAPQRVVEKALTSICLPATLSTAQDLGLDSLTELNASQAGLSLSQHMKSITEVRSSISETIADIANMGKVDLGLGSLTALNASQASLALSKQMESFSEIRTSISEAVAGYQSELSKVVASATAQIIVNNAALERAAEQWRASQILDLQSYLPSSNYITEILKPLQSQTEYIEKIMGDLKPMGNWHPSFGIPELPRVLESYQLSHVPVSVKLPRTLPAVAVNTRQATQALLDQRLHDLKATVNLMVTTTLEKASAALAELSAARLEAAQIPDWLSSVYENPALYRWLHSETLAPLQKLIPFVELYFNPSRSLSKQIADLRKTLLREVKHVVYRSIACVFEKLIPLKVHARPTGSTTTFQPSAP